MRLSLDKKFDRDDPNNAHLLFQVEEEDEDDLNGAAEPRLPHVHLAYAHVCTGHIIFNLTLFYTSGFELVVLHVMIPQPYRFSPCLLT